MSVNGKDEDLDHEINIWRTPVNVCINLFFKFK